MKILIVNHNEDNTPLAARFFHRVLGADAVGFTVIDGGELDKWEVAGDWKPTNIISAVREADVVLLGHSRIIFGIFKKLMKAGVFFRKVVIGISREPQTHVPYRIALVDLVFMEPAKIRQIFDNLLSRS